MKTNELRIGNILKNHIVESITDTGINFSTLYEGYNELNASILSPEALTKEWLLKFGFNQYGDWFTKARINVSIKYNKTTYEIDGEEEAIHHAANVHQLQNLYFALTGNELTLNQ